MLLVINRNDNIIVKVVHPLWGMSIPWYSLDHCPSCHSLIRSTLVSFTSWFLLWRLGLRLRNRCGLRIGRLFLGISRCRGGGRALIFRGRGRPWDTRSWCSTGSLLFLFGVYMRGMYWLWNFPGTRRIYCSLDRRFWVFWRWREWVGNVLFPFLYSDFLFSFRITRWGKRYL